MPPKIKRQCGIAIHAASIVAFGAGAVPLPLPDSVPICGAQTTMIVALGKVFDVSLSESAAKSIATIGLTRETGRKIVSKAIKIIPGVGQTAGTVICAATAAVLTELLGWIVADDFFRMYNGEQPENIVEATSDIKDLFGGINAKR